MPMSSAEIAQIAMQNQQQFMVMRSNSYNQADQLSSRALNYGMGIGAPIASGAASVLGATPSSILLGAGASAGYGAFTAGAGMGGIGTAAMGGMAAAMPMAGVVAGGAMAAMYVGNRMMEGAGQQQALNATLANSFQFQNPYGRKGFTHGDTRLIGSAMREMVSTSGPSGEMSSMSELTELSGKMGQMGMMRQVRDAQQFNEKFKELVKTVKTVATDLNTTLTQALDFMKSSEHSGIFGAVKQAQFARGAQGIASSSNLAMSEVTAMGNIGSQISRSYGGLGSQGAIGGMRAIGQIGAAVHAGVLSEEQIYNTTGQTGAEGRQALAASMMSQTGAFLKSGKGRWFMASMAGENGTIDEGAALRYMNGGLGVGDTRSMAGKHLSEVGRASFIRNEGRLRGAVMQRFGANAPAMALMGWASGHGIDINDMNDRSMLFAQRQLGMGRDELDTAVQMAQNMPKVLQEQQLEGSAAEVGKERSLARKRQGIEGFKHRYAAAKEKLNSSIEKVGSDIYSYMSNWAERKLMQYTNDAVSDLGTSATKAWKEYSTAANAGDAAGASRIAQTYFGAGKGSAQGKVASALGVSPSLKSVGLAGGGNAYTGITGEGGYMSWGKGVYAAGVYAAGVGAAASMTGIGAAAGTPLAVAGLALGAVGAGLIGYGKFTGEGELGDRLHAAGMGGHVEWLRQSAAENREKNSQAVIETADKQQKMLAGPHAALDMPADQKALLRELYADNNLGESTGIMAGDRSTKLYSLITDKAKGGDKRAVGLMKTFADAGDKTGQSADKLVARAESHVFGPNSEASLSAIASKLGDVKSGLTKVTLGTAQDQAVKRGTALGVGWGRHTETIQQHGKVGGETVNEEIKRSVVNANSKEENLALGNFMVGEGQKLFSSIAMDTTGELGRKEFLDLSRGKADPAAYARRTTVAAGMATAELAAAWDGKSQLIEKDFESGAYKDIFEKWKNRTWNKDASVADFLKQQRGFGSVMGQIGEANEEARARLTQTEGKAERGRGVAMGIYAENDKGELTLSTATNDAIKGMKSESAKTVADLQLKITKDKEEGKMTAEDRSAQLDIVGKMSIPEMRRMQGILSDSQIGQMASDELKFQKSGGGRAGVRAYGVAALMGVGKSQADKRELANKSPQEQAKILARQAGLEDLDKDSMEKLMYGYDTADQKDEWGNVTSTRKHVKGLNEIIAHGGNAHETEQIMKDSGAKAKMEESRIVASAKQYEGMARALGNEISSKFSSAMTDLKTGPVNVKMAP